MRIPNVENILKKSSSEISKATKSELRHMLNVLNSSANKRIKRIYQSNLNPEFVPALREVGEMMGVDLSTGEIPRFTLPKIKDDLHSLQSAFTSVKAFLGRKTSTLGGARSYIKNIYKLLGKNIAGDIDLEREFWNGYNRFMKYEANDRFYDSHQVVTWIREQVDSGRTTVDRDILYRALNRQKEREDIDDEEKFNLQFESISITADDLDGFDV